MPSALSRHAECLGIALHGRDAYTREHCTRLVAWARGIGRRCGLDADALDILGTAAQLHDVGKIGVPDHVLLKPGPLEAGEWAQMKAHSEFGQRICNAVPVPGFAAVGVLVRHHHEAVDGSGYPDGLHGEAIPVGARIIAICDGYDAMVTTRPYHAPRTPAQALERMESDAGHKLDPWLLQQFIAVLGA